MDEYFAFEDDQCVGCVSEEKKMKRGKRERDPNTEHKMLM